jgi:GNAT superfamily N-acetyltransferase
MPVHMIEIGPDHLDDYASVPCKVEVNSKLQVEMIDGGLGDLLLQQVPVDRPYTKDYDKFGEAPIDWPKQFDLTNWGFFLALDGNTIAGAAAVAFDTPGAFMLEARCDLSVLWDIRSHPAFRGVGIILFNYAVQWSKKRGCHQMKVETQNVNVPACRFYQRMGCTLGEIRRYAYAAVPAVAHEDMLNWYYQL